MKIIASAATFTTIELLKDTFFKSTPTWEYGGLVNGCYMFIHKYKRVKLFTQNQKLLSVAIKKVSGDKLKHTSTKFQDKWYIANLC